MTTAPEKPRPTISITSQPFWDALREHRFLLQRCARCDAPRFPAKLVCSRCWSTDSNWVAAGGRGSVYSYTIVYRAGMPAFSADVPYAIALIELDEGVHVMSNLVHVDVARVHVGMPVRLVFEDVDDELTLYKFEPAE